MTQLTAQLEQIKFLDMLLCCSQLKFIKKGVSRSFNTPFISKEALSLIVPVTLVTSTTTTTTSQPSIEDLSDHTSSSTALMLPTEGSPGCNIDDKFYMDGMQVQ